MDTATVEEVDYESDPEEPKRSLAMRRREASDDEDAEGAGRRAIRRMGVHSDDSDGRGGVAEYEDDEDEDDELGEEVDEDEVGEVVDEVEEDEDRYVDRKLGAHGGIDDAAAAAADSGNAVKELDDDGRPLADLDEEENVEGEFDEEEKKVNEPFSVPTAGAFYMHDDRFRDNAGGRHRRTHGGRRLWESKDDMKWGHDKFEEMSLQERHREERKTSKVHPRGRGKSRGMDHGYPRGNRSRAYSKNDTQNNAPKVVKGRGPRRYEPTPVNNNNRSSPSQEKQSVKPPEKVHHNTGRSLAPPPNVECETVSVRKHFLASSLNSASPPFYPSGTSSKNVPKVEKREVQAGLPEKNMYNNSRPTPQSSVMVDGKHVVDAAAMDRLYINESTNPSFGNPLSKPSSGTSMVNNGQILQSRPQGGGAVVGSTSYPPASHHSQVNKVFSSTQSRGVMRTPGQNWVQPAQVPVQQLGQRPGSGSQSSSPPKTAGSVNSVESGSGEADSSSESSKLKTALVGKGKGVTQGIGAGSFIYGGAQLMGTSGKMNITPGDQNFPHTPAFLPVMQFGGQHPGGMGGVPAVGMAFPGYVAQPQLGMGKSEMTWLPVLAGAAGALGATYCSPYIAVDGSYHAQPTGQTSSAGMLSKETNTNTSSNESKPSLNELESEDVGQRQNKPRRYSEMNFGQ